MLRLPLCAVAGVLALLLARASATCAMHNDCNGHGNCNAATKSCECHDGWGSDDDLSLYKSGDCSKRTCPSGRAWADLPSDSTTAHAEAECSNAGVCDRATGECKCFAGFVGDACQRSACPNDCSGHGRCLSMKQMATMTEALPLSPATTYTGSETTTTWDEDKIFGCVCDSSWPVGVGALEVQEPEWFGPDCSLKHCPSGNDPETSADETDCENVAAADGGYAVGVSGNKCHVDCSNRGICDHSTGLCDCFQGYYGQACGSRSELA